MIDFDTNHRRGAIFPRSLTFQNLLVYNRDVANSCVCITQIWIHFEILHPPKQLSLKGFQKSAHQLLKSLTFLLTIIITLVSVAHLELILITACVFESHPAQHIFCNWSHTILFIFKSGDCLLSKDDVEIRSHYFVKKSSGRSLNCNRRIFFCWIVANYSVSKRASVYACPSWCYSDGVLSKLWIVLPLTLSPSRRATPNYNAFW